MGKGGVCVWRGDSCATPTSIGKEICLWEGGVGEGGQMRQQVWHL